MRTNLLHRRSFQVLITVLAAVILAALALQAVPRPLAHAVPTPIAHPVPTPVEPAISVADWMEVEQMVSEQKLQAALELVGQLRQAAREAGDHEEWTRALVEEVKLRIALHGYETAVRFLADEEWPDDARSRAVLNLFYGHALVTYVHAYSWEIRQRERVETTTEVDLKAWTLERIVEEANKTFLEVWKERAEWGGESIGDLARYIEQNNYPARIRGTLRDAVSYMWVELLSDSSLWRPAQSNELFRLDVEALAGGAAAAADEQMLSDPAVHPLEKVAAVLGDLEAWHARQRRPEAALEARLERLRGLHAAFSKAQDRALIRSVLADRLEDLERSYEWWSMGQSTLAEMVREEDAPDALVRARALALAGAEAHPDSIGGERCRHIVAAIEAPAYSLQAMVSDGLERRSIQVTHRNVRELHLRAYALDLEQLIESAQDYNILPGYREVPMIMARRTPVAEWSVELPETPDYRDHATYLTPQLDRVGAYLVVASARGDFAEHSNRMVATTVIMGDLVVLTRSFGDSHEFTVCSGAGGGPVAGATVRLYRYDWQGGHQRVAEERTGADGVVRFAYSGWGHGGHFVLARLGDDVVLDQSYLGAVYESQRTEQTAALIYTDRSVYRPLQSVLYKTVVYRGGGEDLKYRTLPGTQLTMSLVDANGEDVGTQTVTTNDFGSASGELAIPAGRLLGSWRLRASLGGETAIQVEEYKRPTFTVEVKEPEAPLRLNRPATLRGQVRYYFGLPVVSGTVAWRVNREPVYPPWWWWWRSQPSVQRQVIASGSTGLDAEGAFQVTFTPEADEREAADGVTYRYRLSVDVTDEGGETRSAERSFRLGFVSVEASLSATAGFFLAGQPVELQVLRSDLDGAPRAGRGEWRVVSLEQPEQTLLPADQPLPESPVKEGPEPFRTPGDRLRPRWEPGYDPDAVMASWSEGRERGRGTVNHGADGAATIRLDRLDAGAYRVVYTTTDDFGAEYRTTRDLVVAGAKRTPLALPSLLLAEQTSVPVGSTARLLVRSGLEDQEMVLELYRDGRRSERRLLRSGRDGELVEIAIGERDRGGFGVVLTLIRDHQLMRHVASIFVPWDDRELGLEFATFRDLLRPGADETFRVTVRGADEGAVEAGAAEVLAYMYDRSLDIFAPHNPPRPMSLYPNRASFGSLRASLGAASNAWEHSSWPDLPGYPYLRGDTLVGVDGYGIGGPGSRGRMMGAGFADMKMAAVPAPAPQAMAKGEAPAEEAMVEAAVAEPAPAAEAPAETTELRQDFSETAFFAPHLLTGADGAVTIEFRVPDSVTEWNVWAHAITRDLRSGSATRTTRSVKDLMVRPYLPRFLREGDQAAIKVVVNNAGAEAMAGIVNFEIFDPVSEQSMLAEFGLAEQDARNVHFTVEAGAGTNLTFPVRAPSRVGTVAFRVTASTGEHSDGELRPLPVLPGRMHLVQSRFVTLRDQDRRTLELSDLARTDDPTRIDERLVVTVDAQLFYGVLQALPYLVSYPYECTEQTLNRFLSTGIVSSLYDQYPAVGEMAKKLSARETRYEQWQADDPNRRMALEETPWLVTSRGGDEDPDELINVLDPAIARAQRQSALAKLEKAQTSLGAFPWWPGGPPSPYMTLYILYGFAKALEFEVEVPQPVVVRAWSYMHRHYVDELVRLMMADDCCWETITFLNYALSCYPDASWTGGVFTDDDRRDMLDFSFRHWKQHSPLLKCYLALTLERAGRHDDAMLVFDSVMDSSQTTQDDGTFWAPEDRAWLWYNDTIEGHAQALRTMTELVPDDGRRHGLVQWLFINKKLNHWKSTRATGEVIYALTHYLEHEGALAVREKATVTVGPLTSTFVFEPDQYTGKAQLIIPGEEIDPATMSKIVVEKQAKGFAFASATWHFSTEELPAEARGDLFSVTRSYFRRVAKGDEWVLQPLEDGVAVVPGDELEVQLSLRARHAAEYVHLRDPRGAGFEPSSVTSRFRWETGLGYYEEVRDSGTNFFFEWLPAGEYTFKYRVRANMAGVFKVAPATLQSMYAPEFAAYSAGNQLTVEAAE